MFKKILVVIIIILIILSILLGIWFFFFRSEPTNVDRIPDAGNFFPITTTFEPSTETPFSGTSTPSAEFIPSLRQISKVPTSGFISFEKESTSTDLFIGEEGQEENEVFTETIFRYIERATGHLFEAKENTLVQERLSNTTIPKIQDAIFTPDGEMVILRYLGTNNETIQTYFAELKTEISTSTVGKIEEITKLEGTFFNSNIQDINIFGNNIFYAIEGFNGASVYKRPLSGSIEDESVEVSLPLKEVVIQNTKKGTLAITTKADSRVPGFLFFNDTNDKILGDRNGLTTLVSPSGNKVLYSESRGGEIDLFVLDLESDETTNLSIKTLPEKCVWSTINEEVIYCGAPNNFVRASYPQAWYQSLISFNDNIWKINVENQTYDNLLQANTEVDDDFDLIKLQLSLEEEYLLFINKNDLTLWSLDILN